MEVVKEDQLDLFEHCDFSVHWSHVEILCNALGAKFGGMSRIGMIGNGIFLMLIYSYSQAFDSFKHFLFSLNIN